MSIELTGGPAFPVSTTSGGLGHQDSTYTFQFPGMTLRDYFAAKAMASLLSTDADDNYLYRDIGKWSYEMADEMMKAREQA